MKDNDLSRYVRWGIPGWMIFLAFISFSGVDIVLSSDSYRNSLLLYIREFAKVISFNSTASAVVAFLVAASGIPLGFVIYQVYFYIRWNSPFARDGLFPPFIVGRWNDIERTLSGINENDLIGKQAWRKAWSNNPLYKTDHGWKWRYIENIFIEFTQELDSRYSGLSLSVRYRYLLDLMHTLGASLFGVYLGYLGYLLIKVKTGNLSLTILTIATAISLFILVWLLEEEDKVRKEGNSHASDRYLVVKPFGNTFGIQYSNPSAIYLVFLFATLYLGSPSPYEVIFSPTHLLFRSVVIGFVVIAWIFSKRHFSKSVIWTEFLTLVALSGLAFLTSQWLRNFSGFIPEFWNIGWTILLFLITNMIFIKNRQNTRDDLIAMQNYTIKRCIALRKRSKPKKKTATIK